MLDQHQTYHGGCFCGAIRYEVDGPSLFVQQCCCRDCQKATGAGHTTIVGVHRNQLRLTGSVARHSVSGESGGEVIRHFCGVCAGRVYTAGTVAEPIVMIQAGSLDDPSVANPEAVIYTKQAQVWDQFNPHIPHYPEYAPRGRLTELAKRGDLSYLA